MKIKDMYFTDGINHLARDTKYEVENLNNKLKMTESTVVELSKYVLELKKEIEELKKEKKVDFER